MKRLAAIFLFALAVPAFADTMTFTVVGIDCEGCSAPIVKALRAVPGVKSVKLDWKAGVATVDVPAGFDREQLHKALTNLGFEAVFPGETRKDLQPLPEAANQALDVQTDEEGKKLDLKTLLVPGKVTIVDFYANWCGPCSVLEMRIRNYMHTHEGFALRRVNVGKWDTPAAVQATREFRAEALPYVRIYDRNGKFVAAVTGGMWDQVLDGFTKAEAR
ncbi:MAG TPA: cation transporter [Thermoanaerobaculia bacterium]|nr:cation transporter [Thermoanaerobaculia bacterium]